MTCDSPFYVIPKGKTEAVPVRCNRCPPCKHSRVNGWVFRMLEQAKVSTTSHFVTLTYDTRFVPISENGFMTLRKEDFQNFMKRLRKLCGDAKLKYYAVGEYGTNNKRPHYHAVMFNVPDPQLFADAWSLAGVQLGSVHIGKVTGDSIAYTMKYIDKLQGVKKHSRDDRAPEFPLMSMGLGKSYLTPEMIAYHQADISRLYVTKPGGDRVALPRYYRQKIYSDTDLKLQVELIQTNIDKMEAESLAKFNRLYPGGVHDYSAWKECQKYARFKSFYAKQKNRDL